MNTRYFRASGTHYCKCGALSAVYYSNGNYKCLTCHYEYQRKKEEKQLRQQLKAKESHAETTV